VDFRHFSFQNQLWQSLKSEVCRGATSHAYLFYGLAGSGKKTMAHAFLQSIMCEDTLEGEPCGHCENCLLIGSESHPDLYVFSSDDKKSVSVEKVRGLIADVYIKPFKSKHKVYFIAEADKLTVQAQNALLKVLEEPPSYTVFLLICDNISAMIDTVLSRVIKIPFEGASDEELKNMLLANYGGDSVDTVVASAGGSIGRAKELMENADIVRIGQEAFTVLEKVLLGDETEIFSAVQFFEKQKTEVDFILDFWLTSLHDVMMIKSRRMDYVVHKPYIEKTKKMADKLSLKAVVSIMDEIKTAQMMLARFINLKEVMYHVLLKIGEDRHE